MTAIEKAQALFQQKPLPDDIEAQLDALYKEGTKLEQEVMFPDLYEALFVLQNSGELDG